VPIHAVISDGQRTIRLAVQKVLPGIPHQLCQYHYLKEASKPILDADRHAKTELKKYVRGVREVERKVAKREDPEADVVRSYCLAVGSSLSDEGKPPLQLPGVLMHDRLTAIVASLERVQQKGGLQPSWSSFRTWWDEGCLPRPPCEHRCRPPKTGSCRSHAC
jgi:hypothetical protein